MPTTVIVPARSGSRRIPRKNVLPLLGTPILARTLGAIHEAGVADNVIVTTDEDEIEAIATTNGALVIRRSPGLADEHTPLLPVMRDAIQQLLERGIVTGDSDAIAMVFATAITMDPGDLTNARDEIPTDRFVVSVSSYAHPPQRGFHMDATGRLHPVDPAQESVRTQDLPEWYHDAAQFVWGRTKEWMSASSIFANALGYAVPRWRCVDLDTPEDLTTAQVLLAGLASLSTDPGP